MRFAVTKACGGGGGKARAGVLYVAGAAIETPSLLLSTRKGLPAFVSRDLLSSLPSPGSHLLHVSPIHFIECPASKTISNIGGLHQMLGLHQHILVAVASDSVESLPESESTNKLGASFETPCGRLLVKPSKYMEMISSMKPNMWASLADEVPAWVPEKRNTTSVDRTLRWLDDCLAVGMKAGIDTLGAIVGGSSIEERKRCAREVSRRNVSGYWIGGFGLGESSEERSDLLNAVTDCLPEEKLRFVSRLSLPEEVLQGVAAGIDLFDSTYVYHLTLGGLALVFPLDILDRDSWDSHLHYDGGDCTKINLRATIYISKLPPEGTTTCCEGLADPVCLCRKDTSPIVDNCSCFTCQNHTRAYINHLLNVHEMLAQILLEIHNTHHYMGFFHSLREAIKGGKFEVFRQQFIDGRRSLLTKAVACS